MTEWQDISSAPKDGTRVLVVSRGVIAIARFTLATEWEGDHGEHWVEFDCEDYFYSSHLVDDAEPTLWMPLPAPPQNTTGETK